MEPQVVLTSKEDALREAGFTILTPGVERTVNANVGWLNGSEDKESRKRACVFEGDSTHGTAYGEVVFLDAVELVFSTQYDARCARYERNARLKTSGRIAVKK